MRKEHEVVEARIALLQQERERCRRSARSGVLSEPRVTPVSVEEEPTGAEKESEVARDAPYAFSGTVARFLGPALKGCMVLIYGGYRADCLEKGMKKAGIDGRRVPWSSRLASIPTQGRRGRPLAIVDITDCRSMEEGQAWFNKVSDALPVGGLLATISKDIKQIEFLSMLGESYEWAAATEEGSCRNYRILVQEKGPNSEEFNRVGIRPARA